MLAAAESSTDADWHELGCRYISAPSHLPSPYPLSARVWYESLFFTSASSLEKLSKIQYAALRLCTRAMKNTPSICLLHSCDELPLHLKHQLLCHTRHTCSRSHTTPPYPCFQTHGRRYSPQLSKISACSPSTQSRWTFSMYMSLMHHTYRLGSFTGHTSISP